MGNDGKRIHEKHSKVSRAKCTQLFELIGSHEHCVYLAAYPHHSLHVYIREAGLRLYSVTYLPTIERMTEVERGQGGHLQVLNFKRDKGNYPLHTMISLLESSQCPPICQS